MIAIRAVEVFSTNGHKLRGILHIPDKTDEAVQYVAVLLPGMTGTRVGPHRILFDLAQVLANSGIPAARFDLSGSGYSDGDFSDVTFERMMGDVRDILDFFQQETKTERFLLGGICRGAKIALAVSLLDRRISHLILLSCHRLQNESVDKKVLRRRWYFLKRYLGKLGSVDLYRRVISGDINFRVIVKTLLYPLNQEALSRLTIPDDRIIPSWIYAKAVFIFGENDPDIKDSLAYYQSMITAPDGAVIYRIIPESDPGFYACKWHQNVLQMIKDWLKTVA